MAWHCTLHTEKSVPCEWIFVGEFDKVFTMLQKKIFFLLSCLLNGSCNITLKNYIFLTRNDRENCYSEKKVNKTQSCKGNDQPMQTLFYYIFYSESGVIT